MLQELEKINTEIINEAKTGQYYLGRFIPKISETINTQVMFVAEMPTFPSKKDKWNPRDNFFLTKSDLKFVKLLNKLGLAGCYITDVVKKCALAGEPTEEDLQKFKPYLQKEISTLNPKVIVSLGERTSKVLDKLNIQHINIWHPSYPDRKNEDKGLWLEYENQIRDRVVNSLQTS
jgi:uracil-DNA glycosylase